MTDLQKIKIRIFEEEKIEELLELMDCHGIHTEQNGDLWVSALPDGDNPRSVQVRNNEGLSCSIRSKGISGDIYNLVSYIVFEAITDEEISNTLPRSKQWICEKLGYMEYVDEFHMILEGETIKEKPRYNNWLKKVKQPQVTLGISTNETIDEKELEIFPVIPYKKWIDEGICYHTQKYFGVGIDLQSERVTFPVHNKFGELIGVKGRYCGNKDYIEDNFKYLYLLPCNKSYELFNLHRAIPHIKEKKEVIIVEGAKTVMLLWSWGYKNAVSIEGDHITKEQIHLLKGLGMDIKHIFAWDKDKEVDFIKKELSLLNGRMKYILYDTKNLLEGKDSPTDKGIKVWEELLDSCLYKSI